MNVDELLALTGQRHAAGVAYDKILTVSLSEYACVPVGTIHVHEPEDDSVIGAVGINAKENRIVDIGVDPRFRRRGVARLLVMLSRCDLAYTLDAEAEKFWAAMGWQFIGHRRDKNDYVKAWRRR